MEIRLVIDDKLIKEALRLGGQDGSIEEILQQALQEYVVNRRIMKAMMPFGVMGVREILADKEAKELAREELEAEEATIAAE